MTMTTGEARVLKQIEVMKAFAAGKAIEIRSMRDPLDPGMWYDCVDPVWNWDGYSYRVKVVPRTCYVAFRNDDGVPAYCLAEHQYLRKKDFYDKTMHFTYVKMQEL
jgi:hypothetical protein